MVRNLQSLGKTIVLTTHYMDEAEHLADRVAIMVHGRIVAQGTPGDLVQREDSTTIRFRLATGPADLPPGLEARSTGGGQYTIVTDTPTHSLHLLTGWATDRGLELEDLTVSRPSLEDVFMELTASPELVQGRE